MTTGSAVEYPIPVARFTPAQAMTIVCEGAANTPGPAAGGKS